MKYNQSDENHEDENLSDRPRTIKDKDEFNFKLGIVSRINSFLKNNTTFAASHGQPKALASSLGKLRILC